MESEGEFCDTRSYAFRVSCLSFYLIGSQFAVVSDFSMCSRVVDVVQSHSMELPVYYTCNNRVLPWYERSHIEGVGVRSMTSLPGEL